MLNLHRKLATGKPLLLQFSVRNFRSIEETQELSFIAASLKDRTDGLLESAELRGAKVLPALVLYGANASGKSNVIAALRYMRNAVLNSQAKWAPDSGTRVVQFLLGSESEVPSPSMFEVNFIFDGIRYQFGFEATPQEFVSEWLYWYPNQHQQKLYTREGAEIRPGRALKGQREAIKEITRPNSLYLSAAAQSGHDVLSKVRDAFTQMDFAERPVSEQLVTPSEKGVAATMDARAIEYLAKLGTGISAARRQEEETDKRTVDLIREMGVVMKRVLESDAPDLASVPEGLKRSWLELGHKTKDGRTVYFVSDRESAGTKRLLQYLEPIFEALDAGGLMIMDEMSNSLHTKACEAIFGLFSNPLTNPKGAQLLAATHDTNLLRSPFLRRDQVWFVEKNEYGASHIYPLTDIKTKSGDDIAEGYVQGRFGAIPYSGQIALGNEA